MAGSPDPTGHGYLVNPHSVRALVISARLAYIARHGAGFLFNNQPPPAPGWPRFPTAGKG